MKDVWTCCDTPGTWATNLSYGTIWNSPFVCAFAFWPVWTGIWTDYNRNRVTWMNPPWFLNYLFFFLLPRRPIHITHIKYYIYFCKPKAVGLPGGNGDFCTSSFTGLATVPQCILMSGFFVQTIQYWACFLVQESTYRLTHSPRIIRVRAHWMGTNARATSLRIEHSHW